MHTPIPKVIQMFKQHQVAEEGKVLGYSEDVELRRVVGWRVGWRALARLGCRALIEEA